eukprot:3739785-Prymnesium_polylepis.1
MWASSNLLLPSSSSDCAAILRHCCCFHLRNTHDGRFRRGRARVHACHSSPAKPTCPSGRAMRAFPIPTHPQPPRSAYAAQGRATHDTLERGETQHGSSRWQLVRTRRWADGS